MQGLVFPLFSQFLWLVSSPLAVLFQTSGSDLGHIGYTVSGHSSSVAWSWKPKSRDSISNNIKDQAQPTVSLLMIYYQMCI